MRVPINAWGLLGASAAGFLMAAGAMIALNAGANRRAEAATVAPHVDTASAPAAKPAVSISAPKKAADHGFVIKRILPISGPIRYGEWHWDETDVPDGPLVITVDLDARVISVFRAGYEIGAAAVLLGTDEFPTPTGVFPITQKRRHHVSNLYDAEMPYMQRLTNDGVALHASQVEIGYASHGCIGMPEPFAAKVFGATKLGDRVFITRGKMIGLGDALVES